VAAPTAGLHFTPALVEALEGRGVGRTAVTLHVGPGTFRPVRTERPSEHAMHAERFEVSGDTSRAIARARERGGRVVAVGTTSVRALESAAGEDGVVRPMHGRTSLFITPPYRFKAVDALLTNFHLPRSTLLMMVCAFGGYEAVMQAYREAVRRRYRFYSYGDCMLIL
jgi:S-adenosylmethionine:tRNA ribosyltransferase-isomerase